MNPIATATYRNRYTWIKRQQTIFYCVSRITLVASILNPFISATMIGFSARTCQLDNWGVYAPVNVIQQLGRTLNGTLTLHWKSVIDRNRMQLTRLIMPRQVSSFAVCRKMSFAFPQHFGVPLVESWLWGMRDLNHLNGKLYPFKYPLWKMVTSK